MHPDHFLVVGLGKTGQSVARDLHRNHHVFSVFDTRQSPSGEAEFRAEFPNIDIFLGTFPDEKLAQISAMIVSPGVPLETPCIQAAKAKAIPVYGDIECLARQISDKPVIAITGTNGKSTVTTLVGLMTTAFGIKTAVAGNIGTPVLDLLADDHDYAVWVLELSSFQLEITQSLCATSATILNISPDHLDRHHSLEAYIAAKHRIYLHASHMVYNREDKITKPNCFDTQSMSSFGLTPPVNQEWGLIEQENERYLAFGEFPIVAVSELKIKGRHNWANALAACALVYPLGIPFSVMREVLSTFSGLPHRSQWVRNLDDVDWINDSKGTNVGATQSAIAGIGNAISGKVVLIAGGQGKGADFGFLRDVVQRHVRTLVLLGQDADLLEAALSDLVPVKRLETLELAVQVARDAALPGDVVLLSPACASLDMFRDFNHRGEVFSDLVGKLRC